jgi:hypothetical protein
MRYSVTTKWSTKYTKCLLDTSENFSVHKTILKKTFTVFQNSLSLSHTQLFICVIYFSSSLYIHFIIAIHISSRNMHSIYRKTNLGDLKLLEIINE